ncbi:MAG: (d)CMP kinase [Lentisphaerales bacterium]|nr:(d)CMP kinase [Lentisphaerales bacterium]
MSGKDGLRNSLLEEFKQYKCSPGIIADGRDMGTTVFCDAQLKLYVDASLPVRAKRKKLFLEESGKRVSTEEILFQVSERDKRDQQRGCSPLKVADGAIVVDNSCESPLIFINQILKIYMNKESL